jgi:hypothetical protein
LFIRAVPTLPSLIQAQSGIRYAMTHPAPSAPAITCIDLHAAALQQEVARALFMTSLSRIHQYPGVAQLEREELHSQR